MAQLRCENRIFLVRSMSQPPPINYLLFPLYPVDDSARQYALWKILLQPHNKKSLNIMRLFKIFKFYCVSISLSRIQPSWVVLHTNSPFCHIRPKFSPRELALTVASMSYSIQSSTRKGLWKYIAWSMLAHCKLGDNQLKPCGRNAVVIKVKSE